MAESPFVPPPRKPVSSFTTPVQTDGFYVEVVNRDDPAYKAQAPVKRGTLYSSMIGAKPEVIATYPTLYFLRETRLGQSDQLVQWLWASDRTAESTFNAEISYALEAVTSPTFARTYTIRRDAYDDSIPLELGLPLTGLIGVTIENGGGNYTRATGTIDTDATVEFVCAGGEIISGVVTNEGTDVLSQGSITITGDGAGAEATAIIQPSSAVLIAQKKSEFPEDSPLRNEYIQVTRVYQTLPGPTIYSTRIDDDGDVVQIATTQKIAATIVSRETLLAGTWTKIHREQQDNVYVGNEVVETRDIPGNPVHTSKVDDDGLPFLVTTTLVDKTTVTSGETLNGNTWCTTHAEPAALTTTTNISDLVVKEVVECRHVPGYPMTSTKLDAAGNVIYVVRTLKDVTTIVPAETVVGNVWYKTYDDARSGLVAWEVVEGMQLPGNTVPSAEITNDYEVANKEHLLRQEGLITPSASADPTFVTTVEKGEVSDLVSEQITTNTKWVDKALYAQRLPESLIPVEFRASIPTVTESHILVGTASMPTLTGSQIYIAEQQLNELFYELRTETLGLNLDFPIIQIGYENTELYGGATLEIVRTLNNSALTVDTGEDIVRSEVNPIGENLMWIRETARRYAVSDPSWPENDSRLWDENMRLEYDQTEQVVPAGTSEDPDPGGAVFAWVSEVKAIDQWRSQKINSAKPTPAYTSAANALITYQYKPYRFPGLLYWANAYYIRSADATLVQHLVKTWWLKNSGTPSVGETGSGADVEIDEIILDDVLMASEAGTGGIRYSGPVLHDDYYFGTIFYPATTPSYTEYALGTPGPPVLNNIASLYNANGTGYSVGDVLTIAAGGYSMSVTVVFVYDSGSETGLIGGTTIVDTSGTFPPGRYGPIASSGGGSGAYFNVTSAYLPSYTPGAQWIGTYRVVGASVTPEREKNVWKVQTESVVMR